MPDGFMRRLLLALNEPFTRRGRSNPRTLSIWSLAIVYTGMTAVVVFGELNWVEALIGVLTVTVLTCLDSLRRDRRSSGRGDA
jgi:hypothetical protein